MLVIVWQDEVIKIARLQIMLGNLLDGRYKVIQVLSAGGFGETYITV